MIEQDDQLAAIMVQSVLHIPLCAPFVGLVVRDGSQIPAGAVIVNNYDGLDCDVIFVGRGCWTVPVMRDLARYIYGKLGCARVTAKTRPSNVVARRALEKVGFRLEGELRAGFGTENAFVYGLTATEQKLVRL